MTGTIPRLSRVSAQPARPSLRHRPVSASRGRISARPPELTTRTGSRRRRDAEAAASPLRPLSEPALAATPLTEDDFTAAAPFTSEATGTGLGVGHDGSAPSACLAAILLLCSVFLQTYRLSPRARRPSSLSYAPSVPPG